MRSYITANLKTLLIEIKKSLSQWEMFFKQELLGVESGLVQGVAGLKYKHSPNYQRYKKPKIKNNFQ